MCLSILLPGTCVIISRSTYTATLVQRSNSSLGGSSSFKWSREAGFLYSDRNKTNETSAHFLSFLKKQRTPTTNCQFVLLLAKKEKPRKTQTQKEKIDCSLSFAHPVFVEFDILSRRVVVSLENSFFVSPSLFRQSLLNLTSLAVESCLSRIPSLFRRHLQVQHLELHKEEICLQT